MCTPATRNSLAWASSPAERTRRDTFNDGDGIYRPAMLLKTTEDGDGYRGAIVLSADSDRDGA